MRPGPRPVIAPGVLPTLRRAILSMQLVVVRYAGPDDGEPNTRVLCPYGILYGGRGWLVAHVDETTSSVASPVGPRAQACPRASRRKPCD